MVYRVTILAILIFAVPMAAPAAVLLHDFDDISNWSDNEDGGNAPQVSIDREYSRDGAAMRIEYTDSPPHWGNLVASCNVPADALELHFWVYKHSAEEGAAMHIWLFEPDDDGWVQRVPFSADSLAAAEPGWHEIKMPVSEFRFEPRGQRTRQMTSVNRILIGCNFADLEVTVDNMSWRSTDDIGLVPLPRTEDLEIEAGPRGNIAILDMGAQLPDGFTTAHVPEGLAAILRDGGFGVTVLRAGDLADPEILTIDNFAAVILPWGPYFPEAAREVFVNYLKSGGGFLSTDGYAFDRLVALTDDGWREGQFDVTAQDMGEEGAADETQFSMNTRVGRPGDQLGLRPDQIGVFDPAFELRGARKLRPADWAKATPLIADLEYAFDTPVEGFSSCGLIGYTSAVFPPVYRRWVPILQAFESAGARLRGTALSIMHNYDGPFKGSSWAFTGLTDGTDLFFESAARRQLLCRTIDAIVNNAFLHDLRSDFACYEVGETAELSVTLSNYAPQAVNRRVVLLAAGDALLDQEVTVAPGDTTELSAELSIDEALPDFCPIEARLYDGDQLVDRMQSAFCARSEQVLQSGPDIDWTDNYLTVDGRPNFLVGSNQTGMMYFSAHEDPAIWDRDFRKMRDHNFHILRILHFSPFSEGGYQGRPTNDPLGLANRPKKLVRQMDAIVQLAAKHRVAILLTLHDWMGVTLTDEQLQAQADWNAFWTRRYRDVPGIFYDVQNEPSVGVPDRPDIAALWNDFLQGKYRTDENLRAAWGQYAPDAEFPNIPLPQTTNEWDDMRAADIKRFQAVLLNRWVKANVDGVRRGDPDAVVTVGYLPSMPPADKILGVEHQDFSNMHYYGSVDGFPHEFKLIDRSFEGKGFSLGECGAQESHNQRAAGGFGLKTEESIHRYNAYIHYGPGLGASFLCNWDWKDFDEMVFPWGLLHHCTNVPKPWLHNWEQSSLLLSGIGLEYEPPQIAILVPDSHRIGPHFNQIHSALHRCVNLMMNQRVRFGVINEEDIESLDPSVEALVWPIPYCPTDETFAAIRDWVEAGGALYLSGGIGFDAARRPTRADRREQLGLPPAEPVPPFETPDESWTREPVTTTVGNGGVFFVPFPLELRENARNNEILSDFVDFCGLDRIPVEPPDAPAQALYTPVSGGGAIYTLIRRGDDENLVPIGLPRIGAQVELAENGFAFIVADGNDRIVAAETDGRILIGDTLIGDSHGGGLWGLRALDGRDLRRSRQLLVLPHQCQSIDLPAISNIDGAHSCTATLAGLPDADPQPAAENLSFSEVPGQVAVIAPAPDIAQTVSKVQRLLDLNLDE